MKGFGRIAAVILAGVLLTGCSAKDSSAEEVHSRGTLRIAVQDERLYELSEYIAVSMGVKPEYIIADKENALRMLADGKADAAMGYYSQNDNPGLEYSLTIPFDSERIYTVCAAEEFISAAAELNGRLLGADEALSESAERALAAVSADGRLYCSVAGSASEMLAQDELDAFLCLESKALELISADNDLRCYVMPDMEPEYYCAVVLRSKTQLYGEINGAIGEYLTGGK